MLSIEDFLIIYLACGAPFGASYFFQHRKTSSGSTLWLKTFLTVVVWIPYALGFLHEFVTSVVRRHIFFNKSSANDFARRKSERLERAFVDLLAGEGARGGVFELREAFQRYAGLSEACLSLADNESPGKAFREIYLLGAHQNPEIGARCQFRRNAEKLRRHQKRAVADLLALFEECKTDNSRRTRLQSLFGELFAHFKDERALRALENILPADSQTDRAAFVTETEKNLWNPVNLRQLPIIKVRSKQPEAASTLTRD